MKKRIISCSLTVLMLLAACTAKQTENQSVSSQLPVKDSAASTAADQQDNIKTDEAAKTVEGYQFIPDYGICEKGSAPVYMMDPEQYPVIKEEDAEAELLSAVYQNGTMMAKLYIKDYSAVRIPEDEAKVLMEKEREDQKKQEQGEAVEWDDSYITIDAEKEILVRSPFIQRMRETSGKRNTSSEKRSGCIYGEGIPDVGYSFTRSTNSSDYDNYLEEGYITIQSEYYMEDKALETAEPSGSYQIKMPGFTDTLSFEFVPAIEIASLEELPGYASSGGVGIYTVGSHGDEGVVVQYYTYSESNEKVYPDVEKLTLEKDGKAYEKIKHDGYFGSPQYSIAGIGKGRQGEKLLFQVPPGERSGSFTLSIPQLRITSQEESEIIDIEIPEDEAAGDWKIEFTDCTMNISKVEKMKEPVFYGNINGEDVKKPAVYLTVETDVKSSDKMLYQILGIRPDSKYGKEVNPYVSYMIPDFDDSEEPQPYGRLMGFYAFYEEGDQMVQVQFKNPSYLWNHEFVIPVELTAEN